MILVRVLFLWFSHFSQWLTPPAPPICKTFNIHHRKKKYVEFDSSMDTALAIFLFLWADNDLVCVPPLLSGMSPFLQCYNYSHTFAHNSKTTSSIFEKLWEIATSIMTVTNLQWTQWWNIAIFSIAISQIGNIAIFPLNVTVGCKNCCIVSKMNKTYLIFESMYVCMSYIYSKKSNGPNTEPCWHRVMFEIEERQFLIEIVSYY